MTHRKGITLKSADLKLAVRMFAMGGNKMLAAGMTPGQDLQEYISKVT